MGATQADSAANYSCSDSGGPGGPDPIVEFVAEWSPCSGCWTDLSCEAYRRTLYQPYEIHAQRNLK